MGRLNIKAYVLFNHILKYTTTGAICLENTQFYSTKSKLMKPLQLTESDGSNKVTVVGIGQVGMACAFSILSQVSYFSILMLLILEQIFLT